MQLWLEFIRTTLKCGLGVIVCIIAHLEKNIQIDGIANNVPYQKKRERERNAVILNHTISCTGNVCRPWADRHSFICSFIQELSGSQPEIILFSRGICQCLEIFWVIPSGAGGSATGILWIVTRDAAKHPIICKAAHYNKELSRPKCQ